MKVYRSWCSPPSSGTVASSRGKKTRKRSILPTISYPHHYKLSKRAHIRKKQLHCTPTWAIPRRAAPQAKPSISSQQPMSSRLRGRTRILAMAHVPEVVPRSTNHGERPSDVRRRMIFACWGRYETRMPTRMKLEELLATGGGLRNVRRTWRRRNCRCRGERASHSAR